MKYRKYLIVAILIIVASVAARGIVSLRWQMVHDSPLMVYAAFLMDRYDAVPYKDFFDMNMPGTYFINLLLAKTLGYSDMAFRGFDLVYLAALSAVTYLWTRRIHKYVAYAVVMIFPLTYLSYGSIMSMQREYLALLPFAGSLAVIMGDGISRRGSRFLLVGILWGVCILIKPQILVGAIPLVWYMLAGGRDPGVGEGTRCSGRNIVLCGVGTLVPVCFMIFYLALRGGLGEFKDIMWSYWPLYSHLTGSHAPITGVDRFWYLVTMTIDGIGASFWLPAAIAGLLVCALQPRQPRLRRRIVLVWSLVVSFAVYPALSGQFWYYHWLPFHYMVVVAAGLCIIPPSERAGRCPTTIPRVVFGVFLLMFIVTQGYKTYTQFESWREGRPVTVRDGVPDRISGFLRPRLKTGDTVQPLDWTGGAVHGMLLARARLATRFMYDFHFYHHIDSPYIRKLRSEFIEELGQAKPRFIIDILRNKPWVHGENTTDEFEELTRLIEQNYRVVRNDPYFRIYELGGRATD